MRAIKATKYGTPDVLELVQIPKPVPAEDQVLIRVHANGVSQADVAMRRADSLLSRLFLGLTKPRASITGTLFAGKIEAIGAAVTEFKVGDDVFGQTATEFGTNAEYLALKQTAVIARIPENVSYEEAAPICDGAVTVHNFLTKVGPVKPGMKVLINGASGGLGTSAVQLTKHLGAEVTGVASGANFDLVAEMGADHLIDYRHGDITTSGVKYDVIFDLAGKLPFGKARRALKADGTYLSPVMGFGILLQMAWTKRFGRQKAKFAATGLLPHEELREALVEVVALIEAGKMWTVIDRTFPIEQIRDAHAMVERGGKRGNVVVTIDHAEPVRLAAE